MRRKKAMTPNPKELREPTDRERLREIVKTLKDCNQDVNVAVVMEQFRYETNRLPTKEQLRDAIE